MNKQLLHYNTKLSRFSWEFKHDHPIYQRHLKSIASIVMMLTEKKDKILEVGCGEGLESSFIEREKLILSDISTTRTKSKCHVIDYNAELEAATKNMLIKFGKFDMIFEVSTLHHIDNMSQAIKNLKKLSDKIVFFEPVIWNPQTFILSLINIKYETHFFKMVYKSLYKLLRSHFKEINHFTLYGEFHYFSLLLPYEISNKFRPFMHLTKLPKYNVFVCR
jgi:2-polyprenyl-3-methyl-5-hydroxy-6-metoxy-1,4-benzoquinol methylase